MKPPEGVGPLLIRLSPDGKGYEASVATAGAADRTVRVRGDGRLTVEPPVP
jgi:hypothetical protein